MTRLGVFRNCRFLNCIISFIKKLQFPDDTSCIPTAFPATFLFAYSNDLSSKTVLDTWNELAGYESSAKTDFANFGTVRFDSKNEMDMEFHTNLKDTTTTIKNNLPDPKLVLQNPGVGSNVFDVIEKFFSNTEAPVCGSILFILLKRYPDEADTSRLVSLIRSHHAIVHVITSANPAGGYYPKAMYSVTSKTNGLGPFEPDSQFWEIIDRLPMFSNPYPVYSRNIQVTGSGTMSLPALYLPKPDQYWICVTYQDHLPIDSLKSINIRWTNPNDSGYFEIDTNVVDGSEDTETYASEWNNFGVSNYNMTLDYDYLGTDAQNLQIRIYSKT
ncbi:hypothetical protein B9Z55_003384 [Caenorhabditis nigoni]|nr:hypothetical protein B9Z55_003384 [Caenorhabditis nigoni]